MFSRSLVCTVIKYGLFIGWVWGQDRWIYIYIAYWVLFCMFMGQNAFKQGMRPIPSHLEQKSLINGGLFYSVQNNLFLVRHMGVIEVVRQANRSALRTIVAWLVWPSRGKFLLNKEVQFKKVYPSVKTSCPLAENINKTPADTMGNSKQQDGLIFPTLVANCSAQDFIHLGYLWSYNSHVVLFTCPSKISDE